MRITFNYRLNSILIHQIKVASSIDRELFDHHQSKYTVVTEPLLQ